MAWLEISHLQERSPQALSGGQKQRVAIAAVKTLSRYDLIGVLSYNWQGAGQKYWDVPLQPVGDKTRIIQHIKKMSMGDLPDLDAVMRPGVDELADLGQSVAAKHMIVISDFDPAPPRGDLIKKMKANNIDWRISL